MRSRWFQAVGSLAAVVLICAGCGSSPAPGRSSGAAGDPVAQRAAFIKGLNGFCRAYYEDQKRADERYPTTALLREFDRAEAAATRHDDRMLTQLHPLPTMRRSYARFVANEKALYRARVAAVADAADGRPAASGGPVDRAIEKRHAMARALGASECDGVLPPSQRRAAVAALRSYELNRDPHAACFTLVTPEFTKSTWPGPHSDATCLQNFSSLYSGSYPVPTGIRVSSVTGVEDLSATVNFTQVPDCGCGNVAARLYFEHGRWLVRSGWRA